MARLSGASPQSMTEQEVILESSMSILSHDCQVSLIGHGVCQTISVAVAVVILAILVVVLVVVWKWLWLWW